MNKKIFLLLVIASFLFPHAILLAQNTNPSGSESQNPAGNLLNLFKNMKVSLPNLNIIESGTTGGLFTEGRSVIEEISHGNFTDRLAQWWQDVNNWFSSHINISLSAIVKTMINCVIWIWEFIIQLLRDLANKF